MSTDRVRFGSELRVGDWVDGREIAAVARGVRGEIHVTFTDGTRRSYSWNQQVLGYR